MFDTLSVICFSVLPILSFLIGYVLGKRNKATINNYYNTVEEKPDREPKRKKGFISESEKQEKEQYSSKQYPIT